MNHTPPLGDPGPSISAGLRDLNPVGCRLWAKPPLADIHITSIVDNPDESPADSFASKICCSLSDVRNPRVTGRAQHE